MVGWVGVPIVRTRHNYRTNPLRHTHHLLNISRNLAHHQITFTDCSQPPFLWSVPGTKSFAVTRVEPTLVFWLLGKNYYHGGGTNPNPLAAHTVSNNPLGPLNERRFTFS